MRQRGECSCCSCWRKLFFHLKNIQSYYSIQTPDFPIPAWKLCWSKSKWLMLRLSAGVNVKHRWKDAQSTHPRIVNWGHEGLPPVPLAARKKRCHGLNNSFLRYLMCTCLAWVYWFLTDSTGRDITRLTVVYVGVSWLSRIATAWVIFFKQLIFERIIYY